MRERQRQLSEIENAERLEEALSAPDLSKYDQDFRPEDPTMAGIDPRKLLKDEGVEL